MEEAMGKTDSIACLDQIHVFIFIFTSFFLREENEETDGGGVRKQ